MSEIAGNAVSLQPLTGLFGVIVMMVIIICFIIHNFVCAMMRNIVGTRAEAPVCEQNHNCSPILSAGWVIVLPDLDVVRQHCLENILARLATVAALLSAPTIDESVAELKVQLQRCLRMGFVMQLLSGTTWQRALFNLHLNSFKYVVALVAAHLMILSHRPVPSGSEEATQQ